MTRARRDELRAADAEFWRACAVRAEDQTQAPFLCNRAKWNDLRLSEDCYDENLGHTPDEARWRRLLQLGLFSDGEALVSGPWWDRFDKGRVWCALLLADMVEAGDMDWTFTE